MSALSELEESIQTAADRAGPAVVGIEGGWRGGSGVVVRPGLVLTAAYNLRRDESTVVFADGRRASGSLAGADPDLGVAAIATDTADIAAVSSEAAETEVRLGRAVFALANPGGRGLRVTAGFVSNPSRGMRGPGGRRITGAIEHTAPLPRGSSGGPLIDADGHLLGINTVRVDPGLILAVPAGPGLEQRIDAIARGEERRPFRLGVALAPPPVARRLRQAVGLPERDGLLIRAVEAGSAAKRAGLRRGDLIVSAQGQATERVDTLYAALDAALDTGSLELEIVRGDDQRAITVALTEEDRR